MWKRQAEQAKDTKLKADMARVHHEIRERPPIKILPRTEAERRQRIIALDDEYILNS